MPAILQHAASEIDSNLYYATHFLAGDPFTYLRVNGRKIILTTDLELGRARDQSTANVVVSMQQLARTLPHGRRALADLIVHLLRRHRARTVTVPDNTPGRLVDDLRRRGLGVRFKGPVFYERRMVKSPAEVAEIRRVQRSVEEATAEAFDIIRKSKIRGNRLSYRGRTLTSEWIRGVMSESMLRQGSIAKNTIVACGDQSCDPHNRGRGPLRPHQSIIFDVFPRSERTLFFADMSRTIVKGRASEALKRQYAAVKAAQKTAFDRIRPGADGKKIHTEVQNALRERGYTTEPRNGKMVGFFHGTGHGVGLDIHEAPWISTRESKLPKGAVVTVEPGLYYFGTGGVRLEDMVLVTPGGCRNLTRFPKVLEV